MGFKYNDYNAFYRRIYRLELGYIFSSAHRELYYMMKNASTVNAPQIIVMATKQKIFAHIIHYLFIDQNGSIKVMCQCKTIQKVQLL